MLGKKYCFEKDNPSLKETDLKKLAHKVIIKLVAQLFIRRQRKQLKIGEDIIFARTQVALVVKNPPANAGDIRDNLWQVSLSLEWLPCSQFTSTCPNTPVSSLSQKYSTLLWQPPHLLRNLQLSLAGLCLCFSVLFLLTYPSALATSVYLGILFYSLHS